MDAHSTHQAIPKIPLLSTIRYGRRTRLDGRGSTFLFVEAMFLGGDLAVPNIHDGRINCVTLRMFVLV